ncbi:hypothetical protein F66182_6972 [Fusarium sp. NRRL 66182]|nr:hypothetical protein F66182_6972 [Fusarium sp. NRRL 66182]
MTAIRGPRIPTGSAAWVADERASALQIVDVEVDEFTYAAHNEFSWLNEHMASIFSENETNIAETFKTPGKLRGKTPRTTRKLVTAEPRVVSLTGRYVRAMNANVWEPLSNVFGGTPSSSANRFAQHLSAQSPQKELLSQANSPSRHYASSPKPTLPTSDDLIEDGHEQPTSDADGILSDHDVQMTVEAEEETASVVKSQPQTQGDSGYFGSQDANPTNFDPVTEDETSLVDPAALDEAIAAPLQQSPSRVAAATPQRSAIASPPAKTQQVVSDNDVEEVEDEPQEPDNASPDDAQSQSDGSSPVRRGFRNSLQFPSLPAREPLTGGKSLGHRYSRPSYADPKRPSNFGRSTRGKSITKHVEHETSDDEDEDAMDVDDPTSVPTQQTDNLASNHNKTYTQMLQERISVLGKSQPNGSRSSKSITGLANTQQSQSTSQPAPEPKSPSPKKQETTTPGAFPEDDSSVDWIDPPADKQVIAATTTPSRPSFSKSRTADIMEGIHGKKTLGSFGDLNTEERTNTQSPARSILSPERPSYLGHSKSASVPAVPLATALEPQEGSPLKKTISASDPSERPSSAVTAHTSPSPAKSPSRLFRDSPLKHLKNKMSSILTTSKGLIASSAALSAEGKSSLLSPSRTNVGTYPGQSTESVVPKASFDSHRSGDSVDQQSTISRPVAKRTRASVEREKEEKRREKEAKYQAEQMEKLEKEREKEREKARVFSKEQEKLANMEKQVAAKKDAETAAVKATPKATRTSPRRAKAQEEPEFKAVEQDVEMTEASSVAPQLSIPRSAVPGQLSRPKEHRRLVKPGKETATKAKAAPTVIRVNTGSQQPQYHPGSSVSGYQDYSAPTNPTPQPSLASKASMQPKAPGSHLKASVGSSGRPRALDLAAKKKEQDDREAQRRRDEKAESERRKAAANEEKKRQEQLRRQEEDRQKREQADAKKNAQRQAARERQAMIEKAKKTPAPPPAVRSQPNGPPDYSLSQSQRGDGSSLRPPSRLNSNMHRSQDEVGRSTNANGSKSGPKRTLGHDSNEDGPARHPPSRGPQYQAKDAKRRRTSDDFADELDAEEPRNIKAPPYRPSNPIKRDPQAKTFTSGYVSQHATQNLFKTAISQPASHAKGGNPMDMAQIHKGAIPFAPNPNPVGPSYKTPARPGAINGVKSAAKSAQRSSPRFQNGEAIELPEIQTDDEDEDEEEQPAGTVAAWANSPYITEALYRQETMDPSRIFGPPVPLNMEDVFSKNKDRIHKFRARTSSANWSGADRLTEDDIRKDLAARDKLRREGGWSYELAKDMS